MDIAKALTFITEDERWLEKLAIGVGIVLVSSFLAPLLIGLLGFFIVAGYAIRLLQNVRDGQPRPLPEWNQWSEDFVRGLKIAIVTLIWALPLFVVVVPMGVGVALADSGREAAEIFGGLILFGSLSLTVLYGLVVALLTPGFTIAFARDEEIRSGLQLTEIWQWTQQHLGQVLLIGIVYLAASFALGITAMLAGLLLCGVGLIVTMPLSTLVIMLFQHHLYGQLARENREPAVPATTPA
jgi:MFS family permease